MWFNTAVINLIYLIFVIYYYLVTYNPYDKSDSVRLYKNCSILIHIFVFHKKLPKILTDKYVSNISESNLALLPQNCENCVKGPFF